MSFFVLIHTGTWFRYTRRPHFSELGKFGNLYVVEAPLVVFSKEFLSNVFKSLYFYFKYSLRLRKDTRSGAYILRPLILFPIFIKNKHSFIRNVDIFLLSLQMKRFPSERKNKLHVYFLTGRSQGWFIKKGKNNFYALDMNDEWSMIGYNSAEQEQIENSVRNLIKKVDMVTTVTIKLKDKYNEGNKVHFLPNAVDINHYVPDFEKNDPKIPEKSINEYSEAIILKTRKGNFRKYYTDLNILASMKRPVVGSISGFGGNWSDFGFMADVEKLLPENINLVSSGNVIPPKHPKFQDEYKRYVQNQRMIFLEYLDYSVLPDFLKYLDVGIVMHRMDDFNKHSAPNKIWAYLAMGLPVVSTDFLFDYDKEIFEGMVKFAKTPSHYVQYIQESILENSIELKIKRRELAIKNSTLMRASKLKDIILKKLLENRNQPEVFSVNYNFSSENQVVSNNIDKLSQSI